MICLGLMQTSPCRPLLSTSPSLSWLAAGGDAEAEAAAREVCAEAEITAIVADSTGTAVISARQAGNAVYLAAQATQSLTVRAKVSIPPTAVLQRTGNGFKVVFRGEKGRAHAVEAVTALDGIWQELSTVTGNGPDTDASVTLPISTERIQFFRIRAK